MEDLREGQVVRCEPRDISFVLVRMRRPEVRPHRVGLGVDAADEAAELFRPARRVASTP